MSKPISRTKVHFLLPHLHITLQHPGWRAVTPKSVSNRSWVACGASSTPGQRAPSLGQPSTSQRAWPQAVWTGVWRIDHVGLAVASTSTSLGCSVTATVQTWRVHAVTWRVSTSRGQILIFPVTATVQTWRVRAVTWRESTSLDWSGTNLLCDCYGTDLEGPRCDMEGEHIFRLIRY